MNIYDVLKRPILSEKTEKLKEKNIYVFEISVSANRALVKEAIQKIHKVTPIKVNTLNVLAKSKRNRYGLGFKSRRKKAYVYLSPKEKLDIFES